MRRDVFQAIADPTRREIIILVARGPLTLNDVADRFDVSRQAISKHIKILTECGIIVIEPQGRERYCSVQPKELDEVGKWLGNFRKIWEAKFDRLDNLLLKIQASDKTKNKRK